MLISSIGCVGFGELSAGTILQLGNITKTCYFRFKVSKFFYKKSHGVFLPIKNKVLITISSCSIRLNNTIEMSQLDLSV